MRRLRLLLLIGFFCPLSALAFGMEIYDQNGCKFWEPHPRAGELPHWNGECKEGYGEGKGALVWFNGTHPSERMEATFVHGKTQGQVVVINANGQRTEFQSIDGERVPTAPYSVGYPSGEEDQITPLTSEGNSSVKVTFANGDSFEGEGRGENGFKWLHGVYLFANGDEYQGAFSDRTRSGHGVFTWANGRKYEGDFVDGSATGHGVETLPDGSRYDGGFRNFAYLGHGVYRSAEGTQWEGEFLDAKSMDDRPWMYIKSDRGTVERTPEFRAWATTTVNSIWASYQKANPSLWRKFSSDLGYLEATIDDQGKVGPWRMTVSSSWSQFDEAYLQAAQSLSIATPSPLPGHTLVLAFEWVPAPTQNFAAAVSNLHVPPNARYAQLTPAQKELVKSTYEGMADADEPPYPVNGMGELTSNIHKAAEQIEPVGRLRMAVDVDQSGQATAVNVIESPGSRTSKVMAAVLMLQKYKPGICGGVPCKMQFYFDINFMQIRQGRGAMAGFSVGR